MNDSTAGEASLERLVRRWCRVWWRRVTDPKPPFVGPSSRQIRVGEVSPYIHGTQQDIAWKSWADSPAPRANDVIARCDQGPSNAPCHWSKTHPLSDTCCMCGASFPGWGHGQ
jgi:hypothetical protein